MTRRWQSLPLFALAIALVAVPPAVAKGEDGAERTCNLPNAAGSAIDRASNPRGVGKPSGKKKKQKQPKVTLQAEAASASKVVNLGDDREADEVTLHVTVSPKAPPKFENKLAVVADPFINSSETGETVSFAEPTFSKPKLSGNRKRVTFTLCVDAPNDLDAGKYTTAVRLEGPPSTEPAVMTVTLNAKDGGGFRWAAGLTALLSFLVLLYKGAGERRTLLLAEAEKEPAADRKKAVEEAQKWWRSIWSCFWDLGWFVPTVAAVASAFTVLYAAYVENPAWGEGGIVTNAIALIGTALAAIGVKTVFSQSPSGR